MEEFLNSGKLDKWVAAAMASDNPLEYILRATYQDVFGAALADVMFPSRAA